MTIALKDSDSGTLEWLEINQNDDREVDGWLQVTRVAGYRFLSLYITDSYEQCSVSIDLTKDEAIALSKALTRMLAEAD